MPSRPRPGWRLAARACVALALVAALGIGPAGAAGRVTTSTKPPPVAAPLAKSWLLVDVDTGRVLDAHEEHIRRRPASTIKLLTVLSALRHLPATADVTASPLAASMPARKMGFAAGTTWPLDDMVASAIIVSANDAAVALGEASAGTLDRFSLQLRETANALGVVDEPVLDDPAGLDDEFAHGQGNWISAWDLAVIGRAAFAVPRIRELAAAPIVRFTDPDGHPHRLVNHNRLLTEYDGGNGLKPGYTRAAGNTFVGTATRDGRTMLVVVLDAPNLYRSMTTLFDKGFATDAGSQVGPLMRVRSLVAAQPSTVARTVSNTSASTRSPLSLSEVGQWIAVAVAALSLGFVEVRRRRGLRR